MHGGSDKSEGSHISEQAREEVPLYSLIVHFPSDVGNSVFRYMTMPSKPPKRSVNWLNDANWQSSESRGLRGPI